MFPFFRSEGVFGRASEVSSIVKASAVKKKKDHNQDVKVVGKQDVKMKRPSLHGLTTTKKNNNQMEQRQRADTSHGGEKSANVLRT